MAEEIKETQVAEEPEVTEAPAEVEAPVEAEAPADVEAEAVVEVEAVVEAEATEEPEDTKVTFESVVKGEIEARLAKYEAAERAAATAASKANQDLNDWYREAIASPEYERLEKAAEAVLSVVNDATNAKINEEVAVIREKFDAEWEKASNAFDALYERNPEKAVKRAIEAVDYLEYEYTKQNLKAAEMVVDFYIELAEFQLEYLRWMKKFCKNPERQLKKASYEVERFMKKAERAYKELQDELKKASYSDDSVEAEFAQALRAFLDKYVG